MRVAEPAKELRFTRGAQAAGFAVTAAVFCIAAAAMAVLFFVSERPPFGWGWTLLPLPVAFVFFRLAHRCVRHAYVILTPLGIELFPFFRPRKNLRVIYWHEIAAAEVTDDARLVLHFDRTKSSGVVASLAPIPRRRRPLLARAIEGRMADRGEPPANRDSTPRLE